ncbi:AAA family ATPase [Bacillus sp. AGMB 02131]|uniref:AAA family ATPase n=1 Tax=Peribacillus faecalis TaxID=2772559 RepID=A0A927HC92_9BACI|nr:AAA domain-containing protein [Peribacillus faecalis]MBD3109779.1 AAA family ATPase [Peribacillus faecalis]
MEKTSLQLLKEWQKALHSEIAYLKEFGSNKYMLYNGRRLEGSNDYTYYFDSRTIISVPNGSTVKLQWGSRQEEGRMLSSEGKGVIVQIEKMLGEEISEAYLLYDPWQLLEELSTRLEEIKKSKNKRARIKRLLTPDMEPKHPPVKNGTTKVKELFIRSKYNPVTFVWGPPGTGKTYTLARVAANQYLQKKKVLILAQSNAAVDVLMAEIFSFLKRTNKFKEGDILRYGAGVGIGSQCEGITMSHLLEKEDPDLVRQKEEWQEKKRVLKLDLQNSFSSQDSQELLKIENRLSSVLDKMRKKEQDLLQNAEVIGTTLARAAMDPAIYEHTFDVVIVDEASMCYVPQAAFAASLGKKVIICGDFKQLPPIAHSRAPLVTEWLKNDVFHAAGVADTVGEHALHPHLVLLNEQRRMHPDISSFTNRYVYHSLVHDHESVKTNRQEIIERKPFADMASILLDTSFTGHYCINERSSKSRWNPWQLLLSYQVMHEAYMDGARSIGYVTPYRVQADMMNSLLDEFYPEEKAAGNMMAATVHKFQGSEREVIVFDSVDGYPQERPGMLLVGNDSERLINVAITRTKGKFVHINNREFAYRNIGMKRTIRQLVQHQVNEKQTVTHQQIGSWVKNQRKRLRWIHAMKEEEVFADINHATKSIIISLPAGGELSSVWKERLKKTKAKVTLISEDMPVKAHRLIVDSLPFPFVMIDRHTLWLGQPFALAKGSKPPFVAARLQAANFCEQFLSHLPLDETI